MTNYVEIKKFDQKEFESRCAQIESIYNTYSGADPMQPTESNPYRLYGADLLPEGTNYRSLPGAMHHFMVFDGLEAAFEVHAQAVKDGYVGIAGALITPDNGFIPVIEWTSDKPVAKQKKELKELYDLVRQRYVTDLQAWNEQETERQIELRVAAIERAKEKEEQERLAAIRQQALEELQNAYKE
ncbi:hypothetical protein P3W53_26060 [Pseudomonas denitrificans (nom. rej.)]|nr:hypothetical protein [Pseudomonas denitrificans (nom. rej.)]